MTVAERVKNRREALKLSQDELAKRMGLNNRSSVAKIEKSGDNISLKNVERLSQALSCSIQYLMGFDVPMERKEIYLSSKGVQVKVVGRVAAGIPFLADEDVIGYEEVSDEVAKSGQIFGLLIRGNSMEPRICDRDVVIVRKQDYADDGDIVIALIDGEDATCKRLKMYKDGLALVSSNPAFQPMYFTAEEVANKPVQIVGKVIELRGKFEHE